MPVCFQLFDKAKPDEGPVVLQEVDRLMCEHFEQPCDEVKYLSNWYDSIGYRLACGKSFHQIRDQFNEYIAEDIALGKEGTVGYYQGLLAILDWLEDHYTTSSFYASKNAVSGY